MLDDNFDTPAYPPEAVLLTGPVGCGKTEAAIDTILETRDLSAFSSIWVLLATDQQIHAFRERLLTRSPESVQFGVEFFNFYDLYEHLLDLAGDPQRLIGDTARYQILRFIAAGLRDRGDLERFGGIAALPGFVGLLGGLINELKQGLVFPDAFERAALTRGPKDRDLARIYSGYQDFLRHQRLVDRHGAGWVALDHLENGDPLAAHVDLLIVDGFDQFNMVHARLLAALARQVKRTLITLTYVPGEMGQRFRRFEQTKRRLLETSGGWWRVESLPCEEAIPPAVLEHVTGAIFRSTSDPIPGDETISLIEAPDVMREVQAVMRRIKRLLLDGVNPESVAVVARRLGPYSGALRETARAYGVPLVVREGIPLRENPAVGSLLMLIDLHQWDFPRREMLDTLHSPYFDPPDLTPEMIAALERISLKRRVVRGRDTWLETILRAGHQQEDEDGEPIDGDDLIDPAILYDALRQHFDRITPPQMGTVYDLVGWLQNLIVPDPRTVPDDLAEAVEDVPPQTADNSHRSVLQDAPTADAEESRSDFRLLHCIRAGTDSERVTRDISAIRELMRVLSGIRTAHDLIGGRELITWADFRAELQLTIERATITPPGGLGRLGRVLVTDVFEVRGLPHDHMFILGLAEGIFPQQQPIDALYQEGERMALEAAGIDLQTAVELADETSLFFQVLGLARQSLTLSRYTIDDKGAPCPPSAYWNAIRAVVAVPGEQLEKVKVGSAPQLHEAATLSEVMVAVAAIFNNEHEPNDQVGRVYHWLLNFPAWINVQRGRTIESRRENTSLPFDAYSGLLADPDLIDTVGQTLGPARVWSASQFNEFGVCGFRFFAKRLLRLEKLDEPEEGPDIKQRGSIHHEILEHTYRQFEHENRVVGPENQDYALQTLRMWAWKILNDAPEKYGFRPTPVWEQEKDEMRHQLGWLVQLDFSDDSPFRKKKTIAGQIGDGPRRPFRQEASFGYDDPPLKLEGPAGTIRVRGKIDRMDVIGDQIVVVDYKTGTTPHPVEDMRAGRDYQMMLYILAARELIRRWKLDLEVAGGMFWHITNRKTSGDVLADDAAVSEAQAQLHADIQAARAGQFAVRPRKLVGGHCISFCEFGALCRMSRGYLQKPNGKM
jgi:ATP-dependent helicase/DNAse subunit B